jgi:hypothetical protein
MTYVNAQLMKSAKIAALALCAAALGGCAKHSKPAPATAMEPEPTPLVIDEATQLRDWDRSTAFYANGDTASPPVREKFGKPDTGSELYDVLLDPLYFAGNTLYIPISLFEQPPGTVVYSTGVQIEPTYTAAPVLPPAPPREPTSLSTMPLTVPTTESVYPPADIGPTGGAADPRSGPPRERSATQRSGETVPPAPAPDGTPAPQPPPQPNPTPEPGINPAPAPAPAPDATPAPAPGANPAPAAPADPGAAPAPAPAPDANK